MGQEPKLSWDELVALRKELLEVRRQLTEEVQQLMTTTGTLTDLVVVLLRQLR